MGTENSTARGRVVPFRLEIQQMLHSRLGEAIEVLLEEELAGVLGTGCYERSERRRGYRNGAIRRRVTTQAGTCQATSSLTR